MKNVVFIVCAVIMGVAQAAQLSWEQSGFIKNPGGTSGNVTAGDIYLVDANIGISQGNLWAALYGGTTLATALSGKTLATGTMGSDGYLGSVVGATYSDDDEVWKFALPAGVTAGSTTLNAYQVIQVGDNYYFSNTIVAGVDALNGASLLYMNSASSGSVTELDSAIADISTSGGWYKVAPTPEPTSGVLMLLGMGLLGLRRKRRE